jgi:exopolyphosphatase/guanosine-5'-triphosphate,3'-diphosphate pyrophosphatase
VRVATVDIGTNTVLLLVAERENGRAPIRAVLERAEITRLGEGVDRTRVLAPAAVERTRACLDDYARVVSESRVDRIAIVGTSAMRDAPGGEPLTAFVRSAFGAEVRVLTGDEEARLTFRGALRGLPLDPASLAAVFDIGGGSTEITVVRLVGSRLELHFARSFDLGSVRLTERFVAHDPPAADELRAIDETLRRAFAHVPSLPPGVVPVGVAGTMTTLAAVALGMETYDGARVHGHTLGVPELAALVGRLGSCRLDERRALSGMVAKRADVIVAGGAIAVALLEHWGVASTRISDGGVRWGLAEELLELGQ